MTKRLPWNRENRWRWIDTLLAAIVVIGALLYVYELMVGSRGLQVDYIAANYGQYLRAVTVNLYMTTVAFVVGMTVGFFLGWLRTIRSVPVKKVIRDYTALADASSRSPFVRSGMLALTVAWTGVKYLVRRIGDAYVEIIRGTPLFVQILFAWSILVVNFPGLFTNPSSVAFTAGLVALTANTAGYQAEIFRAGLQTVHSGQVEAARALGFSRLGAMRHVILPQALRLIVPPLTNEYIGLFKASTLVFILGVQTEITFVANKNAFAGHVFEIFAIVTGIFLLLTVVLAKVVQALESRFRIPGLGIQQTRSERLRARPAEVP